VELTAEENITPADELQWSFWKKYIFRFCCVYFFIYIFPFPINVISYIDENIVIYYTAIWQIIVPLFGENILQLPYTITVFENGSGDTTYNYVQILIFFILALIFSAGWTLLDRKRTDYNKHTYWISVYIRYFLAFTLLHYGLAKVFLLQFPFPSDMRLMQTYGDSSPMGLAWTFMGYSPAYNYFTGGAEALAGILLFFRRTVLAGSLLAIAVMSNIVMINFCYDVPVKLFSLHLLLMSVLILSPYYKRLLGFFFMNKAVQAVDFFSFHGNERLRKPLRALKWILICLIVFSTVKVQLDTIDKYSGYSMALMYKGEFEVESFKVREEPLIPGTNDSFRWKEFTVNPEAGYVSIIFQNDSTENNTAFTNPNDRTITINMEQFHYEEPERGKLILTGRYRTTPVTIELRRKNKNYQLVNRGFHWINEYPFNK
jgi:hypothetical protein